MTPDLDPFAQLARSAGLRVREPDLPALAQWCAERWQHLALTGMAQYALLLRDDGPGGQHERELLTLRLTTGESYFFRDLGQFDLLQSKLLPDLMERRAACRTLRLLSAGCASGEEAYSLAMLIDELAPHLAGWTVLIVGADINREALAKARNGRYRKWSFRGLNAARQQRYFVPVGDQWQIAPRLRTMVTFSQLDLVHAPFPNSELRDFDLILCRNMLIYLDSQAVGCIKTKLTAALAEGGYLLTGHNELFGHDSAPLRTHLFAQSAVFEKSRQVSAETDLNQALARQPSASAVNPAAAVRVPTPPLHKTPVPPAVATPDGTALMQAAWRHADAGHPAAAEQACQQAIGLDAFDPQPYFLLAQLAQERGDTSQVKALLTNVIYLEPDFIAAYLELGAWHTQAGEPGRARRMYQTAQAALKKLPLQSTVEPYRESTAAQILSYVERLLAAPDEGAGQGRPFQG